MPEHVVAVEALDHAEELLVVGAVDLVLGTASLAVAVPELAVANLVDRADHEVEPLPEALHERAVLVDGRRLHPELEASAQRNLIAELVAHSVELGEVGLVRAVGDRGAVLEACPRRIVPLRLDAVVNMLGEADLVEVEPDRVERDLPERVGRVVREARVDVTDSSVPSVSRGQASTLRRRHSRGETPCTLLKAREKCSWLG